MERTGGTALRRCFNDKGGGMFKTIFILFTLMVIFAFMYQIFIVFSVANNISVAAERAVMSLASYNKPEVYSSLREGNTMTEDGEQLFGAEELVRYLCLELGASRTSDDSLERRSNEGGYHYRITGLTVDMENLSSRSADSSVTFVTEFTLEIPVAAFWNFGSFEIPMQVRSSFRSKN